jgi:nitroreductase
MPVSSPNCAFADRHPGDELLSTTRTVRKRLDLTRQVELELLEECLDLAFQAPTQFKADPRTPRNQRVHWDSW